MATTMTDAVPAARASRDAAPAARAATTTERPRRWIQLVRIATDPREARADLHTLDLGTTRSTWT